MVRIERRLGVVFAAFAGALLVCWVLALPALAQQDGATAEAGDARAEAGGVNVQYVDCSQVAGVIAGQNQSGDATAVSGQYGDAAAEIANELNISVEQVNACLGTVGDNGDDNGGDDNGNGDDDGDDNVGDVDDPDDVLAGTDTGKTLAKTGGASLGALAAGLLMAGGGLLMRASLRRRL